MKKKSKKLKSRTNWKGLLHGSDRDIDYSDIPETDEKFWSKAKIVFPESKIPMSVRLDSDVVQWFKRQGPGYQTRMNAVLKSYVHAMQRHSGK